jgi:hypothetical protein
MWSILTSNFNGTSVFLLVDHMVILCHTVVWSNKVINLQGFSVSNLIIIKSVFVINFDSDFVHHISDFKLKSIIPFWCFTAIGMDFRVML